MRVLRGSRQGDREDGQRVLSRSVLACRSGSFAYEIISRHFMPSVTTNPSASRRVRALPPDPSPHSAQLGAPWAALKEGTS